uniref:Uncharacterized protein n=1 Tax=Peronospora matthiolae TaxID=2874970 RepID=A0AAV1TJ61_9STRA
MVLRLTNFCGRPNRRSDTCVFLDRAAVCMSTKQTTDEGDGMEVDDANNTDDVTSDQVVDPVFDPSSSRLDTLGKEGN